jgi:hypothetical protein
VDMDDGPTIEVGTVGPVSIRQRPRGSGVAERALAGPDREEDRWPSTWARIVDHPFKPVEPQALRVLLPRTDRDGPA